MEKVHFDAEPESVRVVRDISGHYTHIWLRKNIQSVKDGYQANEKYLKVVDDVTPEFVEANFDRFWDEKDYTQMDKDELFNELVDMIYESVSLTY